MSARRVNILSFIAHGITCRRCRIEEPGSRCFPATTYCRVDHGGCLAERQYKDGKLLKRIKDCYINGTRCETSWTTQEDEIEHEVRCCTDRDYCNKTL
ncbi:Hypothetical predicted protein [Podarcis lilfordi]|uniref:Uncharacterized protein n=1 Tax=Podarcis lilfordi TaxID=74358 RepID=A0AA35P154_9SAUR|nr:Hypothetical predicted protein [Podarcis lilfordi]